PWINKIITYWKNDAAGTWSSSGNWSTGYVPNGTDNVATFTSPITTPRTITLDAPVTLGTLHFTNANSYTIAGSSTLSLDSTFVPVDDTKSYVKMDVYQGNHFVSAPPNTVNDTA